MEISMTYLQPTGRSVPQQILFRLTLAFSVFIAGCGGGGGGGGAALDTGSVLAPAGASISGTAAAGAPIIGTVTLKDSSAPFKSKTVTILANGKYTIDVSGLTPPFMLRADGTAGGRSYSLHSAAVTADINGTINVTPLTDLIVANVAGQIASTFFASGNFRSLTATDLAAQEAALRVRLLPILAAAGVGASIDLLRSSFAADHSGLDRALDALRITVDPITAKATILNIIDNQQIVDDLASKADTSVIFAGPNLSVGLTEVQQIVAGFDAFSALFASQVPASNNAALLAMFDSSFLLDGDNTAKFLSEITSNPNIVGLKFTDVFLLPNSLLPASAPTTASVSFTVVQSSHSERIEFKLKKVGSTWKLAGNQRIARADALSFARLQDVFINNALQSNYIDTGLHFEIKQPTVEGLASIAAVVPPGARYYAVITGAGLPAAGALYVSDFSQTGGSFYATAALPTAYTGNTTPRLNNFGHNQYPLPDASIAAISDNSVYAIKIYHDNGTSAANGTGDDVLLATYTSNAGKRPYLRSELSVASFATITAPTKSALAAFAVSGGTMNFSWNLPTAIAGAKSSSLHYFRSGSSGNDSADVDLAAAATTTSLTIFPASSVGIVTPINSGFNLYINDSFGRELTTIFNGT